MKRNSQEGDHVRRAVPTDFRPPVVSKGWGSHTTTLHWPTPGLWYQLHPSEDLQLIVVPTFNGYTATELSEEVKPT